MVKELTVTRLLANKTTVAILLLLRTQPLHCRKIATILRRGETEIARKLSQLERAGITKGEWIHKNRNIKVYSLEVDTISIQITPEGVTVQYNPEKKENFYSLESIFRFDIPEPTLFIDRRQQLEALDACSFAVVTGIAGIGKTTLASHYAHLLKERGKKVFWHTFSELDSVPYLVKKLATFLASLNYPELLDYLKSDGSDMRVITALLMEGMSDGRTAFFFDDYHLVMTEPMNEFFTALKVYEEKICVISRYRPPFVSVFDEISEIRLGEMDRTSTREMLDKKGYNVQEESVKRIWEKIGGHPLAVELLCQAASGQDSLSVMEEIPSSDVETYLWDEIYAHLPPEEQHMLTVLSIFMNPVTAAEVEPLCPFPHVRTVLRHLMRKNLVKRVDSKYTHHAVTRSFCRSLLLLPDAERLHGEAARVCLQQETPTRIMEAVYHFVAGDCHDKAAQVILTYYDMLINEGHAESLLKLLRKLEAPQYEHQLREVEGELHMLKGEYDTAVACYTDLLGESSPGHASLYRKLGEVHERKREYPKAKSLLEKGLSLAGADVLEQGKIQVKLAHVHAGLSAMGEALTCCERARECFTVSGYQKGLAQVYNEMGKIYRFSDTEKALELLSSGLEISQSIGDFREAASTLSTIGIILYERGQTDEGVTYFEKSLAISEQIGDMVGIARCCNNIGVKYGLDWNWVQAMEYYFRTLLICQKIADKKGIAFSYSNLGRAYRYLGSPEKALDYFFAALELREELSEKVEIAFLYYNIGLTYEDTSDFEQAMDWYEKSLALREQVGHTLGVGYSYASMGKLSGKVNQYEKALVCLNRAQRIHEKEKGAWMIAYTKLASAQVYVDTHHPEQASALVAEGIPAFEKAGDRASLIEAHCTAAEACVNLGEVEQARRHAETSLELSIATRSTAYEGGARRILAQVLMAAGELDNAEEELRLSLHLLGKHRYELGKDLLLFARLCEIRGNSEEKCRALKEKGLALLKEAGGHIYQQNEK
ncbi:MAG: tetratricopeptide repeat protein [Theionarchaea archaeon]|nr:tetratricopeptide repeat protein [Theionarchaea archaeon]